MKHKYSYTKQMGSTFKTF